MADTNFSRSSGTGATGWIIGGGLLLLVVVAAAFGFSGGGTSAPDGAAPVAIEEAPAAPVAPAVPSQ